jgi:Flp pilus assembly pilin Flp
MGVALPTAVGTEVTGSYPERSTVKLIQKCWKDERAASIPETAFLIAFLSLGVVAAINVMMVSIGALMTYLGEVFNEAV